MLLAAYKALFGCGGGKSNALGPTHLESNDDLLLASNERAKLEIRSLEMDIEQQRSAAAEAEAAVARKKSSADRDVEMENRWLVQKLCREEEANRWLMARLKMMRIANRKLDGQLRESQDENRKLCECISKLEWREAEHNVRFRGLKEKCGILSSVVSDVRSLID